jgi:hypothetical protein
VFFRPPSCGVHTVWVEARDRTGVAAGAATVHTGRCVVVELTGLAAGVGAATDTGRVAIRGRITIDPSERPLNLASARVTVTSLLAEAGGAGELVDRVAAGAVRLDPTPGGGVFESAATPDGPIFRMEVREDPLRQLAFALEADRAVLSRFPALCSTPRPWTTRLTTTFVIDDGARPPVLASVAPTWECVGGDPTRPTELRR